MLNNAGKIFRDLIKHNAPLQIFGTINAYCAMLAQQSNCKALYLSGAGVANASYGLPDLGMTNLTEVLEDARRITNISSLPLLVDIDTGWGHIFNIARTIKLMESAGVAAVHIEDQQINKRCGHRPNKTIVSLKEMSDRIKAAVDARCNNDFVIIARTDAYAAEGINAVIDRSFCYLEKGADMIFPEAMPSLLEYEKICTNVSVPILANITEFGKTPLFTREELASVGIKMILYPLSAFRAMSYAALSVYKSIMHNGTQKDLLLTMQTRDELYETLNYKKYEQELDKLMEQIDA